MNVQATFAATLVDEWARCGLRHAVVSPGSRSTPLVVALAEDPRFEVFVRLDERSAGFFALGVGLVSGLPAVLVTTSGTAAAEVHAAVVEAHQAGVPLIVCTADRPPELRDVGAPQAIDQRHLFGTALRWAADPGVPSAEAAASWRSLAVRVVAAARHHPVGPGPVHLNLPFREPLLGRPGPLPGERPGGGPWHQVVRPGPAWSPTASDRGALAEMRASLKAGARGLLVAGEGCDSLGSLYELGARLGWPVLADPRASVRAPSPQLVAAADGIVRSPTFAGAHRPEVVWRFGGLPASKVLGDWLAGSGAEVQAVVDPRWPWRDPAGAATHVMPAPPGVVAGQLLAEAGGSPERAAPEWLRSWQRAEAAAQAAVDEVLATADGVTEPGVARALYASVPPGSTIVAASSMPVRDLEWFGRPRPHPPLVLSNRGANGIDGVTSTALGVAAGSGSPGRTVTALVGDLAFLHDCSALVWGDGGPPAATVVVVDNQGGGIFSFLPQARDLPPATFERLFGTPQGPDPATVARAAGCEVVEPSSVGELAEMVAVPAEGLRVAVARTDRARNVEFHEQLVAAISAAVERQVPA